MERDVEQKGRLIMKPIFVLIIGLPLAAAIAIATSLPVAFLIGSLFLWALWMAPREHMQA